MRRIQSTCLTRHNQHQYFKSKPPPPFTSNKKPKLDHGHGKWKGREKDILHLGDNIAPGKERERYGHSDRVVDLPVKIQA